MKTYPLASPAAMSKEPQGEMEDVWPTAPDEPEPRVFWCNIHQRQAFNPEECPDIGGVMLPCQCVELTGIAEIVEIRKLSSISQPKPTA